jgi:hypothetical protein
MFVLPTPYAYGHRVILFEGLPVYTNGPPRTTFKGPPVYTSNPPRTTRRPSRESWIRRLRSAKRSEQQFFLFMTNPINCLIVLFALFDRSKGPINLVIIQEEPANTPSVYAQQSLPVGEAPTNLTSTQGGPTNTPSANVQQNSPMVVEPANPADPANTLSAAHVQQSLSVPVAYEIE